MEKTIVATDVDGTSEIVKDMENGLLISSKNNEKKCRCYIIFY